MYALRELPGVKEVRDAYTAGGLQGDDGKSSLAVVELDPALEGDAALAVADQVAERLRAIPAPEVLVGGKLLAERTFAEQATDDAVRGETIALDRPDDRADRLPGRARRGLAAAGRRAGDDRGIAAGAERARRRRGRERVRGQRGHAARPRSRGRLQPARHRPLPGGARGGAGRAGRGAARPDDRRRGARGARLRPGRRHRARRAVRVRRPGAVGDGARRRARRRHGHARRPHARPGARRRRATGRIPARVARRAPQRSACWRGSRRSRSAAQRPSPSPSRQACSRSASPPSASTSPTPTRRRSPRPRRSGGCRSWSNATSARAPSSRSPC